MQCMHWRLDFTHNFDYQWKSLIVMHFATVLLTCIYSFLFLVIGSCCIFILHWLLHWCSSLWRYSLLLWSCDIVSCDVFFACSVVWSYWSEEFYHCWGCGLLCWRSSASSFILFVVRSMTLFLSIPPSLSLSLSPPPYLPSPSLPLLFSCPLIFKDGTGGTYGSWYWCRVSQCSTCIYYFLSQYLLILFSPNYFDYNFKSTVCIACKFNAYFKAQVLSSCFKWFPSISILSMIVPVYNAELAPKSLRGRLVSLNQLFITAGIMVM